MRARLGATVALLLLASSARVAAEPAPSPLPRLNIREPARVCTLAEPQRCRDIGPGVFLTVDAWSDLDTELRRSQDNETRLMAENNSLRNEALTWRPGWVTIGLAALTGLAGGIYVGMQFSK